MPDSPITNFKDSNNVDLGKKLVTKDYLLEVYGSILENSPASGLIVTPELWVWGLNNRGVLGINNPAGDVATPVTTFAGGNNWKQVSAGLSHIAAIKTDGSLWNWGRGTESQLGNFAATDRSTPVTTFAGGNDWKQVACGAYTTLAIKTDGSLWGWGRGDNGELGNFSNTNRSTPVTTFAGENNWKQVSGGQEHTAAIKTDGSLWTWGRNSYGALGTNSSGFSDRRSTPVTTFVGGNDWKQVDCGNDYTAAVKSDGSLWTWGRNTQGQLGINNTTHKNIPVTTFAGGNNWKSVACGDVHTIAIKTDGSLWIWGGNGQGQLGTDNFTSRSTPVTTFAGGNNWKQVSGGLINTVAIKTDGSLWGWGNGDSGLIGNNSGGSRLTPVTTFAGGNDWKQVAMFDRSTAAIKTIDYI